MTAEPDELLDALAAAWAEVTEPPLPEGAVQNEEWLEQFKAGVREEVAAMLEIQRALIAERPWLANALLPEGQQVVPVEPTENLHKAAQCEWDGRMSARSAGVWQAMLAAAPSDAE